MKKLNASYIEFKLMQHGYIHADIVLSQVIDLIKVVRSQTSDMVLPCVGDVHIELTGSLMQIFGRV